MRMRKIHFLGNCSGVQQTAGASCKKTDQSGAYPIFIHSLSSPHPRKSTASFPSPRLFRPSLPSPGLFRPSTKVASPDHHKPRPGVEGQISEHIAGGKQRSRSRKAEAETTHEIPRLLFTQECQFFGGSGDYSWYKVSSWISHVLDWWYRARSGGGWNA